MKTKVLVLGTLLTLTLSMSAFSLRTAAGMALVQQAEAETAAQTELSRYVVRSCGGSICIYQEGELVCNTGISVSSLPSGDQALLETGISAEDAVALAALLEDFDH